MNIDWVFKGIILWTLLLAFLIPFAGFNMSPKGKDLNPYGEKALFIYFLITIIAGFMICLIGIFNN